MKNENLEELFDALDFDVEEPAPGHRERFEAKLGKQPRRSGLFFQLWPTVLTIAASFLVAFLIFGEVWSGQFDGKQELASVSNEMKTTQDFYSSAIKTELYRLQQERTPETEAIIEDALNQLEILESDYEKLKFDLAESGQDNRVIYAMISNFQKRIDLLNQVLEKVNKINELNTATNENNII